MEQRNSKNGTVVTACVSHGLPGGRVERLSMLKQIVRQATKLAATPYVLVLPAGFFDAGRNPLDGLLDWVTQGCAAALAEAPAGSVVSLGIDGRNQMDQLSIAVSRRGLEAVGRKFHAAPEENIEPAETPFERERGMERVFDFMGSRFYLAVCYDGFGLKKVERPAGIAAIIDNVHGFGLPGESGSGASYFARYGFAGASFEWQCPAFGAAVFDGNVQPAWPTGVLNTECADLIHFSYEKNQLAPRARRLFAWEGRDFVLTAFDWPVALPKADNREDEIMKYELTTDLSEVRENIIRFNQDLQKALQTHDREFINFLSHYKHWFHVAGTELLGPSKFIGYRGMTAKRYKNKPDDTDGRVTDKQLESLGFRAIDSAELMTMLQELLHPFGKKPNAKAKIYAFR